MSRFAKTLSATSRRLNLAQHIKSRVVLELAADLEDLFEHFVAQGLSEEEATTKALERIELSDEAVLRLAAVHASPVDRLVGRLAERTRSPWERLMLLVTGLFFIVGAGREMLTAGFFSDASSLLWPVAAVPMAGVFVALWKTYSLLVSREADPRRLRSGLPALLGLAVLTVFLACIAVLVEMHQAASSVENTAISLAEQSILCVARIAPMMAFSLTAAVILAVAWFALTSWAAHREQTQAAQLLEGGSC